MERGCLVSIIIPVYNVKPWLVEALDSVVHQTYDNLEIIIVDDGSTDGSGAICDAYAEKDGRVRVVHQENQGLSAARNAGLALMRGEAVAFLDSDDAYRPDYVAAMLDAMLREESDVVICRHENCKSKRDTGRLGRGRIARSIDPGAYDRIGALRALVDDRFCFAVWNKLYRRALWKDVRFPDGHVYEDVDTTCQILDLCRKVYVLEQPLYLHRQRPGSITRTRSRENIRDWLLANSHFNAFIEANTPGIFSARQRLHMRQKTLDAMFNFYLRVIKGETDEGEAFRHAILEEGRRVGVETLHLRTRVAYRMLCRNPRALKRLYAVYRPARVFAGMLLRR